MNRKLATIALAATLGATSVTITSSQATPVIAAPVAVAHAGGAAPWGLFAFGGAVVSLMIRAAVVWNTECRELTSEEAFTGLAPIWPVFHKPMNKCAPAPTSRTPRH